MQLGAMLHETKGRPELVVECFRVIADNVQATAFGRPLGAEGGDDHVAAGLDGVGDLPHVGSAVLHGGKEVKDRTIVPQIIPMPAKRKRPHIAAEPLDFVRVNAYPRLATSKAVDEMSMAERLR